MARRAHKRAAGARHKQSQGIKSVQNAPKPLAAPPVEAPAPVMRIPTELSAPADAFPPAEPSAPAESTPPAPPAPTAPAGPSGTARPARKKSASDHAYGHGHHHHSSATVRFAGPLALIHSLAANRYLIGQLTRRDLLGRYRGSYLGIFWSFLNPLLLLGIFTVVFGVIFQGKLLEHRAENPVDFALAMFAGLIVFNFFSECITRAPTLIMLNANYVTKIVFPLEVLPVTTVLASLVHMFISLFPLWLGVLLIDHRLPWTLCVWPVLLLPLCFFNLGIVWLLSAMGVFLRDLNEIVIALVQILLYASAIFYPITVNKLGAFYPVVRYNPVAFLVEQSRILAVYGDPINLVGYGWTTLASVIFMLGGYMVFMRVKHAFADVI